LNQKLHLEIALIRAIQTLSEANLDAVIDALASLRASPEQIEESKPSTGPAARSSQAIAANSPPASATTSLENERAGEPTPVEDSRPAETFSPAEPSLESAWSRLRQIVASRRPLILSWIELATPVRLENGIFRLGFPEDQELAVESLSQPNNRKFLEDLLGEMLGGIWKIVFETHEDFSRSSAPMEKSISPAQLFKNDPMIQKALEIFKAEIQSDR
jgi:hypothetical protein